VFKTLCCSSTIPLHNLAKDDQFERTFTDSQVYHLIPISTEQRPGFQNTDNMSPSTPTRSRDKPDSTSPPEVTTPRPTIQSEKSFSDGWWTEREKEQQQNSDNNETIHASKVQAKLVEPNAQRRHPSSTMSPSGVPRRDHSVISATSSGWNHYSESLASSVNQRDVSAAQERTVPVFEDDNTSLSGYGSEQENQVPIEVPSTPPTEHTSRRFQREPLKDLAFDRNGRPLHTISSLAGQSLPYPELVFSTSSIVDEDDEFETGSNASTIVLPSPRKRTASFCEEDEKEGDATVDHNEGPRSIKRLKAVHNAATFDTPETHPRPLYMMASSAKESPLTLTTTTNDDAHCAEESDAESMASTVCAPTSHKRGSGHLREHEEYEDENHGSRDGSARARGTKRRRTSQLDSLGAFGSRKTEARKKSDYITTRGTRNMGGKSHRVSATGRGK
jgi:hypothetical protein